MTFPTQAAVVGREPIKIVELVLDSCALKYGNAPCTAGARAQNHPNLIQQSQVFSGGAWGGTATVTLSSYVAPNSTMTGVMLVDSNTANNLNENFDVNSATCPEFAALGATSAWLYGSVHVTKDQEGFARPMLRVQGFSNTTSFDYRMAVDKFTGVWSAEDLAVNNAAVVGAKVVDCGSWWRIGLGFNVAACNSLVFLLYPTVGSSGSASLAINNAAVGSTGFWGAVLTVGSRMGPYLARGVESQWITTGLAGACYNTIGTCQDVSNFLKGTRTLRFVDERVNLPVGLEAFPALVSAKLTPARLTPHYGMGESAQLTIRLRDFPHDDLGVDQYVDQRSYNANSQGTYFGRMKVRDAFFQGRPVKFYEGYYVGSGTHTFSHYLTREFIIDEVDGPDAKGIVSVRATDVLRLTNFDRAHCPVPSTASLVGAFASGATTLYLPSSADAAYYAGADPFVRIDEEIIALGTQAGCSFTSCVRARAGSEQSDHGSGSLVQVCKTFSYMNVCSVMQDLIVNFASIPSSYINVTSWDAEKSATLTDYNPYNILTEPTSVRELLDEVCETFDLALWYDEVAVSIALRHQTPWGAAVLGLSDDNNIVAETLRLQSRDDIKVSRVGIHYAPTNYSDPTAKFSRYVVSVNSQREDPRYDGRKSEYTIKTRWLSTSHAQLAATVAGRAKARYSEYQPVEASMLIDAKDVSSARTGTVVELSTRLIQDVDGTQKATRVQIIESAPEEDGHTGRISALLYQGLSAQTTLLIDVSTYNYNVHSAAGGPTAAVNILLQVGSGVVVGGSGTDFAAITTSGLPAGSLVYVTTLGSSSIYGYKGIQGRGADVEAVFNEDTRVWDHSQVDSATAGTAGGHAVYVAPGVTAFIDVTAGFLFGGGGGGGGGGANAIAGTATDGSNGTDGQGYTNTAGPSAPGADPFHGGIGGTWGVVGSRGVDPGSGTFIVYAHNGGGAGYAVKLADASAVYYFTGGYDSTHVKGQVGV